MASRDHILLHRREVAASAVGRRLRRRITGLGGTHRIGSGRLPRRHRARGRRGRTREYLQPKTISVDPAGELPAEILAATVRTRWEA
jgi:hypothetical protein